MMMMVVIIIIIITFYCTFLFIHTKLKSCSICITFVDDQDDDSYVPEKRGTCSEERSKLEIKQNRTWRCAKLNYLSVTATSKKVDQWMIRSIKPSAPFELLMLCVADVNVYKTAVHVHHF